MVEGELLELVLPLKKIWKARRKAGLVKERSMVLQLKAISSSDPLLVLM